MAKLRKVECRTKGLILFLCRDGEVSLSRAKNFAIQMANYENNSLKKKKSTTFAALNDNIYIYNIMKKALAVYGIAYLALLLFVLALQYIYPKTHLHLLLNSIHTGFEDTFFKYYSMLAEWPLYVLALLPLFWKKYGITLFFALSELTGGAFLQILKHTFCFDRPVCVFESHPEIALPLVEGVNMHHSNSFPSGHASTFFVFFTCCALILTYLYQQKDPLCRNRRTWIVMNISMVILLMLAALGAYSRVYLSQHFLLDVCVGSIIGFISPCLFFYFGRNKILKIGELSKTQEIK